MRFIVTSSIQILQENGNQCQQICVNPSGIIDYTQFYRYFYLQCVKLYAQDTPAGTTQFCELIAPRPKARMPFKLLCDTNQYDLLTPVVRVCMLCMGCMTILIVRIISILGTE